MGIFQEKLCAKGEKIQGESAARGFGDDFSRRGVPPISLSFFDNGAIKSCH
jgi:hypothetical protein